MKDDLCLYSECGAVESLISVAFTEEVEFSFSFSFKMVKKPSAVKICGL